ncbi:hypothetical protein ACNKHK_23260 [Shigella flexneri]
MAGEIQKALQERDISSVIYDGTHPNPTTSNVAAFACNALPKRLVIAISLR